MSDPAPETLTDREVVLRLQLKSIGKLELVVIGNTMYRREAGGIWYALKGDEE
jgi:hypothetical protein